MVVALLREMMDLVAPPSKGDAIQDLEYAMRTKGGVTREQEVKLQILGLIPQVGFTLASGLGSYLGWFGLARGTKLAGLPPFHGLTRFGLSAGIWERNMDLGYAFVMGKLMYYATLRSCAAAVLNMEDERMRTELANMCVLMKHSDDKFLVETVKRHFFSEHLFDDLHPDKPLFRWHPRHSYIDSAFVERMKEIERNNFVDQARSISRQTTVNIQSSGDLMEDPLACVFGSPGCEIESNNPPESKGTVLNRSQLRARRRSYKPHLRHADTFAAL
ncbi:hypothetical protein ACP4OV_019206 [Aristida adscensionis]